MEKNPKKPRLMENKSNLQALKEVIFLNMDSKIRISIEESDSKVEHIIRKQNLSSHNKNNHTLLSLISEQ